VLPFFPLLPAVAVAIPVAVAVVAGRRRGRSRRRLPLLFRNTVILLLLLAALLVTLTLLLLHLPLLFDSTPAILLIDPPLLLGGLPLLLGLHAALLFLDPPLLRLCPLPLGLGARALALRLETRALVSQALLLGLLAPLLLHEPALLFSLPPAHLVVTLLAREHVTPELLVLPPPRLPLALVLQRAALRLAPLLIVVASVLARIDVFAARLHPIAGQPVLVRAGRPGLVAAVPVTPHGGRAAQEGL
jgi:hypothetical protein